MLKMSIWRLGLLVTSMVDVRAHVTEDIWVSALPVCTDVIAVMCTWLLKFQIIDQMHFLMSTPIPSMLLLFPFSFFWTSLW